MRHLLGTTKTGIAALIGRFGRDQRGQIAIIFGLSITMLMVGAGASIDLARAYIARQKLSQVAELTCQYSVRKSVADLASSTYSGTNGHQAYLTTVNGFAVKALSGQNWGTTVVADMNGNTNYFTATAATGVNTSTTGTAPTNPIVFMKASIPTMFMQIVKVPTIAVQAKINCLTESNATLLDITPGSCLISAACPTGTMTNYVLQEGFERPCGSYCFTKPDGTSGTSSTPTSTTPSNPSYYSTNGQPWYILGYCLETDITGQINGTSPEGTHTGELDCDNGSGSAGNSSISTKVYLPVGSYELRYNYRARVTYPNYDPAYICGTTAADVSWANETAFSGAVRTNQINAYLDLATSSQIPLHTTIDGSQQLGGSNLIDVCVYSPSWIERSVKIDVTTPAYYWLSFAADGASDSYGGQLDNIRLCQKICTTPLQDNFPSSWLAANNGGVNKVLFEDTFESPTYSQDPYTSSAHSKGGNLAKSQGVTIPSGCAYAGVSPPGYPCQSPTGWAVAPYNQVVYWESGAAQGSQYISLQGWNGYSNSSDPLNRSISRSFLLDPGYYNINYQYTSLMDFSYSFVYSGNYYPVCTAAPTYYNNSGLYTNYGVKYGHDYGSPGTLNGQYISTDFMNVFLANGQLVSTPIINSTLGGAPTYNNPDGTTSASPTVPLDNGSNFVNYNAAAVNPVIDSCYYSGGFAWASRSINIKVTKPGLYWLTFSAQGDPLTGLGAGPGVDDVKLTALGSYTMGLSGNPAAVPTATVPITAANATPMPIPVPAPQPDSVYYGPSSSYNGFTVIADPFQPPSAN